LDRPFCLFSAVLWSVYLGHRRGVRRRTPMNINADWFYLVLTIVVFAVLWLIVKGVEHFER
jgi:hypothetical protein